MKYKSRREKKNPRLEIQISTWKKKFSTWDKNLDMEKKSRLELKHLKLNKNDLDLNIETLTLKKEFLTWIKNLDLNRKISTTFVQYGLP